MTLVPHGTDNLFDVVPGESSEVFLDEGEFDSVVGPCVFFLRHKKDLTMLRPLGKAVVSRAFKDVEGRPLTKNEPPHMSAFSPAQYVYWQNRSISSVLPKE